MEDSLKLLLDAEARAQAMVDEADRERERLIAAALREAHEAEARFEAGKAEVRAPYLHEAAIRAEQATGELTRKYEERQRVLRDLAARHETDAIAAAMELLLDPRH